jgi:hypothetical protein
MHSRMTTASAASDIGMAMASSASERLSRAKWRRWSMIEPSRTSQTS